MRIADDQLVHLALLALEDAREKSRKAPIPKSYGVRLALTYLASRQECERWPFDQFWQYLEEKDDNGRSAHMTACLNGIYLQVGVRPSSRPMFVVPKRASK